MQACPTPPPATRHPPLATHHLPRSVLQAEPRAALVVASPSTDLRFTENKTLDGKLILNELRWRSSSICYVQRWRWCRCRQRWPRWRSRALPTSSTSRDPTTATRTTTRRARASCCTDTAARTSSSTRATRRWRGYTDYTWTTRVFLCRVYNQAGLHYGR